MLNNDNKSICNCCFENKDKYLSCNTLNCKFKMCEFCYYKWYSNNIFCPHCRKEQILIFDNHRFVINLYDGYYLRRIYNNTIIILLFLFLVLPLFLILLFNNSILNYNNLLIIVTVFFFQKFFKLCEILIKMIIMFNNILYNFYDQMLEENIYLF